MLYLTNPCSHPTLKKNVALHQLPTFSPSLEGAYCFKSPPLLLVNDKMSFVQVTYILKTDSFVKIRL